MADQAQVEQALVVLLARALEPENIEAPVRVYRGWPSSAALDADMAAGIVNVSVNEAKEHWRRLAPLPARWILPRGGGGAAISAIADLVEVTGTAGDGQVLGLLVDGVAYRYQPRAGEDASSIAAALATQIRHQRAVVQLNAMLRLPGARKLTARCVGQAASVAELARQVQGFRVAFWCPTPELRDRATGLAECAIDERQFIDLPDGSAGRVLRAGLETVDRVSEAALFRCDLTCTVEYATTKVEAEGEMLIGELNIDGADLRAV